MKNEDSQVILEIVCICASRIENVMLCHLKVCMNIYIYINIKYQILTLRWALWCVRHWKLIWSCQAKCLPLHSQYKVYCIFVHVCKTLDTCQHLCLFSLHLNFRFHTLHRTVKENMDGIWSTQIYKSHSVYSYSSAAAAPAKYERYM